MPYSCGFPPLVSVMKSAYQRQCNASSGWGRSIRNWTFHRCFLSKARVGSVLVVIGEIGVKNSPQIVFVEDNDMIQAFSPNTSVKPFDVGIQIVALPSTVVKSTAPSVFQCALRKVFQGVLRCRSGAGSIPCSRRMFLTVVSQRVMPRFFSAPSIRV